MPFIPLFMTTLAMAGALASSATAQAAPAAPTDTVVPLRHVAVPPPGRARLTPNTAQLVVARAPASASSAQVPDRPAGPASAAPLALEQPGLPQTAREEARKNGVLASAVPATAATGVAVALQPLAAPAAAEAPGSGAVAAPPPPVFQTMQQAAQAQAAPPVTAAPALPDTAAPASPWRQLTLARVLPLALLFLVLPIFIQWRKRAKRHAGNDRAA